MVTLFELFASEINMNVKQIAAYHQWCDQVFFNAGNVDPDNAYDWESLAIGFCLGQGLSISEAEEFYIELLKGGLV